MNARMRLALLFVVALVVSLGAWYFGSATATAQSLQVRLVTRSANAGWGNCPDDPALIEPGTVCATTYLQFAEEASWQNGSGTNGQAFSFTQTRYTYNEEGVYVPLGNSYGFSNSVNFSMPSSLNQAALRANIPLTICTVSESGSHCQDGPVVRLHVTWTGTGELVSSSSRERRVMPDRVLIFGYWQAQREATAVGQVGSDNLGASLYGLLSSNRNEVSCEGNCE
jgi:hypothetical protein